MLLIPRSDLAAYPVGGLVVRLALLAAGLGAAAALFLRTLARSAPCRTAAAVVVLAGLLLPVLLVALGPGHAERHVHPESFAGAGTDFVPRALACFLFGVALGAPVLLLLLLVLDRSDDLSWPRRMLLAAAVGLVGTLALLLHCPLVGAGHLLGGHARVPLGALLVLALAPRGGTPPA